MDTFLNSNPGLKSRFDRSLTFEDYSAQQMYDILQFMLAKEALEPDKKAADVLKAHLNELARTRDKFFGNARSVRKVVERIVKAQHLRLAALEASKRKPATIKKITLADVQEVNQIDAQDKAVGIGFRTAANTALATKAPAGNGKTEPVPSAS
jgi:Cdc6-like AAA superfamily ATPase